MSADSCQQILDELGPSGPSDAGRKHVESCESCRALLAVHQRMQLEVPPNAAALERVHAAAKAELAKHPRAMRWTTRAGILAAVTALCGISAAVVLAGGVQPTGGRTLLALVGLGIAELFLCLAGLAPARRLRALSGAALGLLIAALAAVVFALQPVDLPMSVGAALCPIIEVVVSVIPLGIAVWALRDGLPSRRRALLAALGAGAGGQLTLELVCPNTQLAHVGTFHFGAWLLVAMLAAFVLTLGRPRSYAP